MASLLKRCRHHVTDRALAIGSGNVDILQGPFGMVQRCTHQLGGAEVRLVGRGTLALKHGELGEQRLHGAFVGRLTQGRSGW